MIKSVMKKNIIIYVSLFAAAVISLTACSEDKLDKDSVIAVPNKEKNAFDKWLEVNYVQPYNISFKYRYEEIEADFNYYTIPADYDQAVELAHIVKYICIDSYNEVGGVDFTRKNFPKEFFLIGEWEYENNGTYILGTAEGGKKILLSGVNYLDTYKNSIYELTGKYLKTIHHEFTHILNQTVPMPTDFQFVSEKTYIGSVWNTSPYNDAAYYLSKGHISAYSQQVHTEDFAEMMSMYVCYNEAQWQSWMTTAGEEGAALIEEKLSIVRRYMKDSWGIDIDELRDVIQRREADLISGKIDLADLSI